MTAMKRTKRKSLKKPERTVSKKKPVTKQKLSTKKSKTKRPVSKKKSTIKLKLSTKKSKTKRNASKKKSTAKLKKSKTTAAKRRQRKNKAKVEVITYRDYIKASENPYKLLNKLIEKESDKLIMLKKAAGDEWKPIDEILKYAFDGQLTIGTKVSENDAVFFADKEDIRKFLTKPNRRDVKTYNLGMVQLKCVAVPSKHIDGDGTFGFPFIPGKSLPRSDVTINTLCTTIKEWERFKKVLKGEKRQKGRKTIKHKS
jgi:hypothetical protein